MKLRLLALRGALLVGALSLTACAPLRLTKPDADRVQVLSAKIQRAEQLGARECAPRDLARAQVDLAIARHEAIEGFHDPCLMEEYFKLAGIAADDLLKKAGACQEPKSVPPPPPPPKLPKPTASLTANPGSVKWGEPTTLSWTTDNATEVSIDGLGPVGATGSLSVTPNVATTYRLVAKGPEGTTEATVPVTVELPDKVCISLNIEFDFDKSDIKPQYHKEIGRVAEFMKTYPKTTAVIEGHTDDIGTKEYNEKLSLRRADAVIAYLVDNYGIEPGTLSSQGYGSSQPVADNATEQGRQTNRRIDAVIDCSR